jgi:small subunit ribosomal protein S13
VNRPQYPAPESSVVDAAQDVTPGPEAEDRCPEESFGKQPGTVLLQTSGETKETHKMARLVGVDLPREKRVEIALTYIFGVGRTRSQQALAATGVNPNTRVRDLSDTELVALRDYLETNVKIEGDLRREIAADIRRKVEIGSYEGLRHRRGLPVRGQRTKTNARTRKGPKRTVAGKKKVGK